MGPEAPELQPNSVNPAGRLLPEHSSMAIADVNMGLQAPELLSYHINRARPFYDEKWKSMNVGKKKTKKKIFRVPQHELDDILSYQVPAWPKVDKRCPSAAIEMEKMKEYFLAGREKMRREYEAHGYATFEAEVTDDEEEEDAAATPPHEEKDIVRATSFHDKNDDAAATHPHEEKDDVPATSYHDKNDEAAATTPHEEKDDVPATSYYDKNDDAAATTPHEEKDDVPATSYYDKNDDAAATPPHEEKDDVPATSYYDKNDDAAAMSSPWIIPRGRGRRRFRPGVVKQASGVKKIT
ncbi:uncharacterized protein LOC119312090 [Triticum dicoccoides]|uniref:uncharacterized protein LOC119312090 n=1 Tax=Triticum dicoccoides TaxID=85692 RepID=UPI000E7AB997|nr:uncharacterized protein LOC119312090 [Triticum dicoccoides]